MAGAFLVLLLAACGSPPVAEDGSIDAGAADGGRGCASDDDCGDGLFCNGVERCRAADGGAAACVAGDPPCTDATAECDEETASCAGPCSSPDADGDGSRSIGCGGEDCDDSDSNRFPGNPEVCDAHHVDEDCDPTTLGTRDADADGHADDACCNVDGAGALACGADCDDTNMSVVPGATEACNTIDDDCDGMVDEGCDCVDGRTIPCDTANAGTGVCVAGTQRCIAGAWGACEGSVRMSAESCNGADDDCDGDTDEGVTSVFYLDEDGDGFGDSAASVEACSAPEGYVANATDACPSNAALQAPRMLYRDADGDSYGRATMPRTTCDAPSLGGWIERGGDCCDTDNRARPNQTGWFSGENDCGDFDYDCNDAEERRWTQVSPTPGCGVSGLVCNAPRYETWKDHIAPCGDTRQMYRWYGSGGCNNDIGHVCDQMEESRRQECR